MTKLYDHIKDPRRSWNWQVQVLSKTKLLAKDLRKSLVCCQSTLLQPLTFFLCLEAQHA